MDGVEYLVNARNFIHHFRAPLFPGFEGLKQVGRVMNGLSQTLWSLVERSLAVATHKGSMKVEKSTGKTVGWSEIFIFRARGGKINELLGGDRTDGGFAANRSSAQLCRPFRLASRDCVVIVELGFCFLWQKRRLP